MGTVLSLDFLGLYQWIRFHPPILPAKIPQKTNMTMENSTMNESMYFQLKMGIFQCHVPFSGVTPFFYISLKNVFLPKARDFHGLHGLFRFTRLAVQQLLGILFAPRQRGEQPSRGANVKNVKNSKLRNRKRETHTPQLKEGCLGGFLGLIFFLGFWEC